MCPVCFNAVGADDAVRTSLNTGIVVLLGITACVLAGFLRFIISLARRSAAQPHSSGAEAKTFLHDNGVEAPVTPAGLQARLEA